MLHRYRCQHDLWNGGERRSLAFRFMRHWYDKLREVFKRNGQNYTGAAVHCGVAPSTVGAWMIGTNEPPIAMLFKLAEYGGVTVPFLLSDDPFYAGTPDECAVLGAYRAATPEDRAAALVVLNAMLKASKAPPEA